MSLTTTYTCNPWIKRIHEADRQFDEWHEKFKCKKLYDYYENFQWKGRTDSPQMNYRPYQLNLFHKDSSGLETEGLICSVTVRIKMSFMLGIISLMACIVK